MIKTYRSIIIRLYKWHIKSFGKNDQPVLSALLYISLLLFINVFTICLFIEWGTAFTIVDFSNLSTWNIGVAIGCLVINYFVLVYKVEVEKISDPEDHVGDTSTAVWYIGLTMITFGIALILWLQ